MNCGRLIPTDLIDEKLGAITGAKKGDTVKKYSGELIALKRTSVPEDVSNTVHFLASKDSDYMTGVNSQDTWCQHR